MKRQITEVVLSFVVVISLFDSSQALAQIPTSLPQKHDYQKVLYKFMTTVTEKDVTHGVPGVMENKPTSQDPDYLYRNYAYSLMHMPMVGTKRGYCAVNSAPACYTLAKIEQKEGVFLPPAWPECLMSMVQWDYPGNPFKDNRPLKMRAFMAAATHMIMFHDHAERNDAKVPPPVRPDWHGYNPVWWASPYPAFKDVLPPEVQKAYEAELKAMGERMLKWGIKGESCENDYNSTVGLLYIARAINDAEFTKKVEDMARPLFTDPAHFHTAGYWDERGGIDTGFGGTANWFASWIALMTDWPFAKDALARVYRLRGHLILAEPDGALTGPSHFNSRLGSSPNKDQWAWDDLQRGSARDFMAALVTDEAACAIRTLSPEDFVSGPAARLSEFNFHLGENSRPVGAHYLTNEEMLEQKLMGMKWEPRIWMSFDFPASVNPGYEHYPKGARARREQLEKSNSPLLKLPIFRGENYLRAFEKDFFVARQPGFAAIIHTGPIGAQTPDDKKFQFAGPLGLGGGQLSAFWTPQAGAVILGLRIGMSYDKTFDQLDAWRTWPIHAVSGITADGQVFTSARIAIPEVAAEVKGDSATIKVGGAPAVMRVVKDPEAQDKAQARDQMYDAALAGKVAYTRTFKIDGKGVNVETTISGDGKDSIAELYETIPVYLGLGQDQKAKANVAIEFQAGGKWAPAADQYAEKVKAVRLTRFGSAIIVKFDKPCRAKLSPAEWTDNWLNVGAACRNVLIDLADNSGKPAAIKDAIKISYTITSESK